MEKLGNRGKGRYDQKTLVEKNFFSKALITNSLNTNQYHYKNIFNHSSFSVD